MERRPHHNSIFFSIFFIVRLISSYIPKFSLLSCLILEIAMKKTLDSDLEDDLKKFQFYLNIFSSQVNTKLHTENQSPSLLNSWDSCEEDLKISILKTTSNFLKTVLGSPQIDLPMLKTSFIDLPLFHYYSGWPGGRPAGRAGGWRKWK